MSSSKTASNGNKPPARGVFNGFCASIREPTGHFTFPLPLFFVELRQEI
jgi:hypothetical protein